MRKGDGLSRKDREDRITSLTLFHAIDNSMATLLCQTEKIASFIRYHNFENIPDGYFDEFLDELKGLKNPEGKVHKQAYNGEMEPSQALLYTFLRQLHAVTEAFNKRWKDLPYWYIDELLGVKPLIPLPGRIWVRFHKNVPETVSIIKGAFFRPTETDIPYSYRLETDYDVQETVVEQAYSVYFERKKNIYPASELNCVTSLKVKDILREATNDKLIFSEERGGKHDQSLGFMIASPALLLREGKRIVTITIETETTPFSSFLASESIHGLLLSEPDVKQKILQLLNNIFYVQISTAEGWKTISNYTVKRADDCDDLILKFILPEDFPTTEACEEEKHAFESSDPVLKVLLNLDAWLYPYSWIKDFLLRRIFIHTCVEKVSNVLVYNELGRIDNSKPFQPFGLNTERGAWFAVGNYEMAIKNTSSIDVQIKWSQLPNDPQGLKGYYEEYKAGIDNTSFQMQPYYLSDYTWTKIYTDKPFYLFETKPLTEAKQPVSDTPLSDKTVWEGVSVNKMPLTDKNEELYDYTIQSKTSFVRFSMTEPAIGFGEKRYRYLFANGMIKNMLRKKDQVLLNQPITPFIERLTINYRAEECIDLRMQTDSQRNQFFHIYPLGCKQVYPYHENKSVPLIYTMESDANILFGLKRVKGEELVRLYLDFVPVNKEIAELEIPHVKWYYGDGYTWRRMPHGVILEDATKGLLFSGNIDFCFPADIYDFCSSPEDTLWLRAGIGKHFEYVPELLGVYTNTAELSLVLEGSDEEISFDFRGQGKELEPVRVIPGITGVEIINSTCLNMKRETGLNKQIRVSEYVTHRGRAVISRDYERITLQQFPEVDKVKCLPDLDTKYGRRGVVTLVVIPCEDNISQQGWQPKASSSLILNIEEYMKKCTSPAVTAVDVINPEYEELMVRCRVLFKRNYPTDVCQRRLKELCDGFIAPWQSGRKTPRFDYSLNLGDIYNAILQQEYISRIRELSVILLVENRRDHYSIQEYTGENDLVSPSVSYAIFVPAKEHLFLSEGEERFGISEMSIDDTFVIQGVDSVINE